MGTIAIVAAIAIAVFLVFIALRPGSFVVQRSLRIQAPPEKIFSLIEDFHDWPVWSPYEKIDPAMTRTHSGEQRGKGAIYEWNGNARAGTGRMEILEATPPARIVIKLDFLKPFEGHNVAEFTMKPDGETTTATWAMRGPVPFFARIMHLFFSMDDIVGKDFETGLANLKKATET